MESVINTSCDRSPNPAENNLESKSIDTGSNMVTEYRIKNLNRIVLATLNKDSIRNKFSYHSEKQN